MVHIFGVWVWGLRRGFGICICIGGGMLFYNMDHSD